jgi:uracil-DNA glycosylase
MGKKRKPAATPSLFDADARRPNSTSEPLPPDVPGLPPDLDPSWLAALTPETREPYWADLQRFVAAERAAHKVYPPEKDVFNAFRYTPLDEVKAVILGQDPYHGEGQAHGLCFSVRPGVRVPESLKNIYTELKADVGAEPVRHGCLASWAKQGVLMLNACLTVRAKTPNSHAGKGWEKFTDAALRAVNDRPRPVVFLLWGAYAQKKIPLIGERHVVLRSAHPSPYSAANGFFGSRPFSKTNAALKDADEKPIDWQLPEVAVEES